jgi:hypothetical protein
MILNRETIQELRRQADRPFGFRPENPELTKLLLDEIERLTRENERLRRSIE